MYPTLWRLLIYFFPGFPKPIISIIEKLQSIFAIMKQLSLKLLKPK